MSTKTPKTAAKKTSKKAAPKADPVTLTTTVQIEAQVEVCLDDPTYNVEDWTRDLAEQRITFVWREPIEPGKMNLMVMFAPEDGDERRIGWMGCPEAPEEAAREELEYGHGGNYDWDVS